MDWQATNEAIVAEAAKRTGIALTLSARRDGVVYAGDERGLLYAIVLTNPPKGYYIVGIVRQLRGRYSFTPNGQKGRYGKQVALYTEGEVFVPYVQESVTSAA
jgi:hypothetical protein